MKKSTDIDYQAVGARIKEWRGSESQSDFGRKYGKSYTDIGRIERGAVKPTPDLLFKICIDYGKTIEELLTGETIDEISPIYNDKTERVDVFTLAGAGAPKLLTEYEPIESIWLPLDFTGPSIVPVKIRGQSMYPTIWDGALVGIDTGEKTVTSGDIYAVWIPYEGAVVKRLFMEFDRVMVKSDNPTHPTLSIPYKELEMGGHGENFILGRVKWIIQKQ